MEEVARERRRMLGARLVSVNPRAAIKVTSAGFRWFNSRPLPRVVDLDTPTPAL